MALQNTLRRAGPFTGTGLVSTYPFAFKVFAETDVAVTVSSDPNGLVEETLKLNADYTVSLNEDQDGMPGGSITLATPLAADTRLTINSVVPADQQMELTNHDGFFPTVLNTAFDKVTALIQQLEEKNTRTVTVPSTSTDTPDQLAKDLYDARDRAEAADKNAAASASASASSAATSKSYADKVTDFKDQIITVSDNMADVKTNAANVSAIKGIGDNLTEVLKSSQYAAEAKNWAEQASAIAGSESLMMPGATQALNIGQWMLRKAQVFHGVAEMKASMVLADGMSCVTEGYYEPGDGGMGFYRIRPMTASDTDDGGSIHALQNGLCAELIVENGTVNVKQFGARGNEIADDTAAIQAAMDFSLSVFLPRGEYKVKTVIGGSYGGLRCNDYQNVVLDEFATLSAISGETSIGSVITIVQRNGVTVTGGKIVADKTADISNRNSFGIYVAGSNDVTIRNAVVLDSPGDGVCLCWGGTWGEQINSTNVVVDGCHISNAYRNGVSVVGVDGCVIKNCFIDKTSGGAPEAGIDVEHLYNHDIRIENSRFVNNKGFDIVLSSSFADVVIDSVYAEYIHISNSVTSDSTYRIRNSAISKKFINDSVVPAVLEKCSFVGDVAFSGTRMEFVSCDVNINGTEDRPIFSATKASADAKPLTFSGCTIRISSQSTYPVINADYVDITNCDMYLSGYFRNVCVAKRFSCTNSKIVNEGVMTYYPIVYSEKSDIIGSVIDSPAYDGNILVNQEATSADSLFVGNTIVCRGSASRPFYGVAGATGKLTFVSNTIVGCSQLVNSSDRVVESGTVFA